MPNKMVKTGKFARKHFELDSGNFRVVDYLKYFKFKEDGGKKKYPIKEVLKDFPIKNDLGELVLKRIAPERRKSEKFEDRQYVRKAKQFVDFLQQMLILDPEKRIVPADALKHPFIVDKFLGQK